MAVDLLALEDLVDKAARVAHSSFPSHLDVDDTKQALWLFVYEKMPTIENMIRDTREREHENKPVYDMLLKTAYSHLKGEDAATHGYDPEDQYVYSRKMVEEILEVVFQHEYWQSFALVMDNMPKAKKNPAHSGDSLAHFADVSSAVDQLGDEHSRAVKMRYKVRMTFEQIGEELGMDKRSAKRRVDGAVSAIQRTLGRRDLGELRKGSESHLRRGTADAVAQTEATYNGS